jgi:4-amino-4-deoxy-L-arabinose transferase-like glycosyltransferase
VALFFRLFGLSEFSARLPFVIWGTLGIVFAFLLARKLSSDGGGLLAAFIMAFSTLNLAHSTQAKPYIALQTILLLLFIIY